jgi:molybdopterin converting factor small subunit
MIASTITIELYGIPRARAGTAEIVVAGVTPREALVALAEACPGMGDVFRPDGRLSPQFLLSLGGTQFLTDLDRPLQPGARLLLLSADAGG